MSVLMPIVMVVLGAVFFRWSFRRRKLRLDTEVADALRSGLGREPHPRGHGLPGARPAGPPSAVRPRGRPPQGPDAVPDSGDRRIRGLHRSLPPAGTGVRQGLPGGGLARPPRTAPRVAPGRMDRLRPLHALGQVRPEHGCGDPHHPPDQDPRFRVQVFRPVRQQRGLPHPRGEPRLHRPLHRHGERDDRLQLGARARCPRGDVPRGGLSELELGARGCPEGEPPDHGPSHRHRVGLRQDVPPQAPGHDLRDPRPLRARLQRGRFRRDARCPCAGGGSP